jgi:hypothetical protein
MRFSLRTAAVTRASITTLASFVQAFSGHSGHQASPALVACRPLREVAKHNLC